MYLMQAENLMKLLRECGFYGTSAHVELLADLEQLRQLNRHVNNVYRDRRQDVALKLERNSAAAKQSQVRLSNQRLLSFPPFPL